MSRPTLSEFKKKALANPSVKLEYEDLSAAYNLRKNLITLRQKAGLTQEQIATILHTQKSNISRLENASSANSPKLSTIEQYAHAVGYDIEINFVPIHKST
ncbi:MAG: helix-turn-helix transcriptional regulator [Gammaproteobacteria bacterium]|nr:helix-turn-helix transcriptional regulator [Gammaproteobacteria bacterium]